MSQRHSRRQFIQTVTAAMAAPTIISARALGAEQRPPASDRIPVAVRRRIVRTPEGGFRLFYTAVGPANTIRSWLGDVCLATTKVYADGG